MEPRFEDYHCEDYLLPSYRDGVFDPLAQQWLILPPSKAYKHDGFLVIGSPGVDGLEWGYRKGEQGIWLYEPITQEFRSLTLSLAEFLKEWQAGNINV